MRVLEILGFAIWLCPPSVVVRLTDAAAFAFSEYRASGGANSRNGYYRWFGSTILNKILDFLSSVC